MFGLKSKRKSSSTPKQNVFFINFELFFFYILCFELRKNIFLNFSHFSTILHRFTKILAIKVKMSFCYAIAWLISLSIFSPIQSSFEISLRKAWSADCGGLHRTQPTSVKAGVLLRSQIIESTTDGAMLRAHTHTHTHGQITAYFPRQNDWRGWRAWRHKIQRLLRVRFLWSPKKTL